MKPYMVNIIRAGTLCSFLQKHKRWEIFRQQPYWADPPLVDKSGWTAQDTSKADNDQSDNFMSVSHKQAITAKGADCRRWLPKTNTNKHTLQTPHPPPPPTQQNREHSVYTHTHTVLSETNTRELTHAFHLYCVSHYQMKPTVHWFTKWKGRTH